MIISGLGILLIFASNQADTQIVGPYPPFVVSTITALNTGAFLMLLGIYNSAALVSASTNLRKSIRKQPLESKPSGLIGQVEMEKEIQKSN
jgi:hypothetical protein